MAELVLYDTLEVCLMAVSKSPRRPCLMERSVGVFCIQCLQVFMEFRAAPRRHGENVHVA